MCMVAINRRIDTTEGSAAGKGGRNDYYSYLAKSLCAGENREMPNFSKY